MLLSGELVYLPVSEAMKNQRAMTLRKDESVDGKVFSAYEIHCISIKECVLGRNMLTASEPCA